MRILLILITIIFTCNCYGQTMSEIKKLLHEKNFQSFKPYIDSGYSNPRKSNLTARWIILREVLPGFQEGIVEVEENVPADDNTGGNWIYTYHINLLSDDKEIFYYSFNKKNSNENNWEDYFDPVDTFKSANKFNEFEAAFLKTYNAQLVKADLFQKIVYGGACGIAGIPTQYQQKLDSLLRVKNIQSIRLWLKSANTEKQLYALMGLKALSRNGYKLTSEDTRLIKLINQKKGMVNTCGGCIYSTEPVQDIAAQIKAWNGDYYIFENSNKKRIKNKFIIPTVILSAILFFLALVRNLPSVRGASS